MNQVLLSPALYSHVLHSGIMLFAIVLLILYFSKLQTLDPYKKIKLALMFTVVIGIHGISHLGLESVYYYNPISRTRFHQRHINCPFNDSNSDRRIN